MDLRLNDGGKETAVGIGKRISRIIRSNLNDMLSAAENPEKQLDLLITEMEDGLRLAKQSLIEQMAVEKRLQKQLDDADQTARQWAARAQAAVDAGEDQLAREALRKKRTYEELAGEYDRQLYEQQNAVDDLRNQYKELEARLAEARERRRGVGVERVRRQRAGERAEQQPRTRSVDTSSLVDRSAFDKFDEMADKVDNLEAETEARRELDDILEPDDALARRIDSATARRSGESRRRDETELQADIELEELRRRSQRRTAAADAGAPASGERLSRRRERPGRGEAPPAEGAPAEPSEPGRRPEPDADDEGWGRRVEL